MLFVTWWGTKADQWTRNIWSLYSIVITYCPDHDPSTHVQWWIGHDLVNINLSPAFQACWIPFITSQMQGVLDNRSKFVSLSFKGLVLQFLLSVTKMYLCMNWNVSCGIALRMYGRESCKHKVWDDSIFFSCCLMLVLLLCMWMFVSIRCIWNWSKLLFLGQSPIEIQPIILLYPILVHVFSNLFHNVCKKRHQDNQYEQWDLGTSTSFSYILHTVWWPAFGHIFWTCVVIIIVWLTQTCHFYPLDVSKKSEWFCSVHFCSFHFVLVWWKYHWWLL